MAMTLLEVHVWCENCNWESRARNAQGNAARHARAHKHLVIGEITYVLRHQG